MAQILVWFWSGGGGGSQFAASLAHRLTREFGADSVALSLRVDDPTIASAEARGVQVLRADVVSDRRRPVTTLSQIAHGGSVLQHHARNAKVVIVAMNFAMAAPLSLGLNKPMVYCAHDPRPHPGDYAPRLQRFTQSALLTRAAKVVALSNYTASLLAKRVPVSRLRVAPLSSVFEPRQPAVGRGPDPVTRLLMPGRMIAYKGLDMLADALDSLADRDDWRLTIAGRGPALTPELAQRFSPKHVTLLPGYAEERALDQLYQSCDVVLAPYRSASQSGVVAEALSYGKPCVVTPVGGLSEQIGAGRAGWVAGDATSPALSTALAAAIGDPSACAQKTEGARQIAREAWSHSYWDWLSEYVTA